MDIGARASKYGAGLRTLIILTAKGEQLKDVIGLEETTLLGVLQNTIGQELLEYLSANTHYMHISVVTQ